MALPQIIATYQNAARGVTGLSVPNVEVGDWLLAIAGDDYVTGSAIAFSGSGSGTWNGIGTGQGTTTGNFNAALQVGYKAATAAGTHGVSANTTNGGMLCVHHLRNCDVVDGTPSAVTLAQTVPTGAQAIGPVSPTGVEDLLFGVWTGVQFTVANPSWGAVTGMGTPLMTRDPNGWGFMGVAVQSLSAAGSTGTRSSTPTTTPTNGFAGKLFAIRGLATPSGPEPGRFLIAY